MKNYIRLPLEGASNVRDLGGYATKEQKVTNFHVFLRGSRLTELTNQDNIVIK